MLYKNRNVIAVSRKWVILNSCLESVNSVNLDSIRTFLCYSVKHAQHSDFINEFLRAGNVSIPGSKQQFSSRFGSCSMPIRYVMFNTLRPRQNGRHFADDISKCIFLNENAWILIKDSLKFVPKGSINNSAALVQIMAWRRPGDKPLSKPKLVKILTHICVTRPQWVNTLRRDKMDAISQTTFSNEFSWMKMYQIRLRFHLNLFPRVQLTIFQHCFR